MSVTTKHCEGTTESLARALDVLSGPITLNPEERLLLLLIAMHSGSTGARFKDLHQPSGGTVDSIQRTFTSLERHGVAGVFHGRVALLR